MYQDSKPCGVCGSEVRLRPHETDTMGEPDGLVDERVCTNPDCETNRAGRGDSAPTP